MTGIRAPNQSTRGPAFPGGAPAVHFSEGPKLIGKTVTLTSGALVAGIATPGALLSPNQPSGTLTNTVGPPLETNFNLAGQILSYKGEAAHYVVSTQGIIQQPGFDPGNPLAPNLTFPFACFVIDWTIGGTNFQTRVDGNSDQFLGIVAEQITVTGKWDEENGTTLLSVPRYYPAAMSLAASLALGQGLPSKAFRTRLMPTNPAAPFGFIPTQLRIPYAAKGFIQRNSPAAGPCVFVTRAGAFNVDSYSGAEVIAAHGRGEYLSVPAVADFIAPSITAVPAGFPMIEFEMYM